MPFDLFIMKSYLILIPIFLLALIQGAFLPLNLVLLLVLGWAVVRPGKEALSVAFVSGIFLDLAKGTPLGFSSLLFLTAVALVVIYSRRFDPTHPVFLAVFVFLAAAIIDLVAHRPWLGEAIVLAILSLLLRPLLAYYRRDFDRETIKLKY